MLKEITDKEYIEKLSEDLRKAREIYEDERGYGRLYGKFGLIGLSCLAYIGIRMVFGANIYETINKEMSQKIIEHIDSIMVIGGAMFSLAGLPSPLMYLEARNSKREVSRLEKEISQNS